MMNAASGRVFSWRRMISLRRFFSLRGVFSLRRFFRCDGSFRCGRALSVAAFGRVLRTLGGRNIGKCRLRAHQHPLLPPLSNHCRTTVEPVPMQNTQGKTRRQRVMNACWGGCWGWSEDVQLSASILDFKPRLANRCKGRMVSPAAVVAATMFRVRFYSS